MASRGDIGRENIGGYSVVDREEVAREIPTLFLS